MLNSTSQSVALEIIAMFSQRGLLGDLIGLLKKNVSVLLLKAIQDRQKDSLSKDFSNILIQNQAYSQKQDDARTCCFAGFGSNNWHFLPGLHTIFSSMKQKSATELKIHIHLHYFRKFNS